MSKNDLSWRAPVRDELVAAGVEVDFDVVLAKRTTFGIGGPADLFAIASDEAQVSAVLRAIAKHGVPLFVLGGGSNLLVGDRGIRGVVLSLAGNLASLVVSENGKSIEVGAGCSFPRLTKTCLELGWPGAVGWMGTPGQVGGAILMNAGSKWGELGADVVTVIAASAIGEQRFSRDQCAFSYRSSWFQKRGVGGARLSSDNSDSSEDQQLTTLVLTRAILQCDNAATEKAQELDAQARELLERRHRTQPKLRSAGSLFKNPPGDFAGRLIEASGLKGFTVGKAQVSPIHANFVVNLGGATAADVVAVADHVVATVQRDHHITLEWEVRRVGDFAPRETP